MARRSTASSYDEQGADPRLLAEIESARKRLATLTDAFERGEMNVASLRTDPYLRHLFDADVIGILFTDGEGQIARANDLFLRMVGYSSDELPLCWRALTPPECRDKNRTKTRELKEVGRVVPWETEIYHRDGRRIPIVVGAGLVASSDEPMVAFTLDLTERKQAEEQLRAHTKELRQLAAAVTSAEERERRRIGSGLHDEVGQILATAALELDRLLEQSGRSADASPIAEVRRLLNQAIERTRSLTFDLTSPVLYELGLEAALRDLGERAEQQNGIRFRLDGNGSPTAVSEELGALLFRVVRELVHNVTKHAGAHELHIGFESTPREVRIRVGDDGVGFDVSGAGEGFSTRGGFGLFSVREQLDRLGGHLVMDSTPNEGTRIDVVVPVESRCTTREPSRDQGS